MSFGRIHNFASWCNGNTSDFDPGIRGSNPFGATKTFKFYEYD